MERGRWIRANGAVAVALLVAPVLLGACGSSDSHTASPSVPATHAASSTTSTSLAPPSTTTTTTSPTSLPVDPATGLAISGPVGPPWPTNFTAADAAVPRVALYSAPNVPLTSGLTLANPTHEGVPLIMSVRQDRGDWLQVQVQIRPNGATAWIKRSDVTLRSVPHHVVIRLGARTATVYRGDRVVWTASVAPGKASSPTPTGSFYVDAIARPSTATGPYGLYQVSFSGFSNVYSSFGAGNGQVAMHGTNQPQLIGTPASHGCVRFSNEQIAQMVWLAPQGTPVDVVP